VYIIIIIIIMYTFSRCYNRTMPACDCLHGLLPGPFLFWANRFLFLVFPYFSFLCHALD